MSTAEGSSRHGHPGADLGVRDSAGYEWEEISQPSPPKEHAHLIPPRTTEPPKQLSGYLTKQGTKGPIKSWKSRWFVFDDHRCCLYYYYSRDEFTPLGMIDISNATLTYSVENLPKCQFEICVPGRVYYLQASSKDAMFFWLEALQKKRRKYSAKRKKAIRSDAGIDTEGGLVADSSLVVSNDPDDFSGNVPEDLDSPPVNDGDQRPRFSASIRQRMTSLSNKIRGPNPSHTPSQPSPNTLRKSNFYVVPPIQEGSEEEPLTENGADGHQDSILSTQRPVRNASQEPLVTAGDAQSQKNMARGNLSRRSIAAATDLFKKVTQRSTFYVAHEGCTHCQELQEAVEKLENDLAVKEREVQDRDEINEFLRSEIRMTDMKAKVQDELMSSRNAPEGKKVDVLLQREQTIQQVQRLLEAAIGEKEQVKTELDAKRREVAALGEQVDLYKEAVVAKDHVVVELTNKLFQLENKGQRPTNPQDAMMPTTVQALEQELEKMREAMEAYKLQNQFLSREIVELNNLRGQDLETYRALVNKFHETEANYCQAKSKLLILLQETQQPTIGSESAPNELVSRMLAEAMQGEDARKEGPAGSRRDSYDRYGFSQGATADIEFENPLKLKARKLDQQAQQAYDETLASQKVRWDNFMASCGGGREMQKSSELKALIRGGVPSTYRSVVWKWCIRDLIGRNYIPGQYQAILTQHAGQKSVAVTQIELDLLRTLPTNKYYDKPTAQGIGKLRRVLVAYSWYDSAVGYCQGLNRLAAIALLFLEEEDAFWCLVAIVRHILPLDYYDKTLLGSQTDQRVLREILADKLPRLSAHLQSCDIDFSLITFNWFHTIYVDNLPVETMLRIWDTFLHEGSKVLFRFAVAIFKFNEDQLLLMENTIAIYNRLRNMCQDATDVNRLVHIGFVDINPFPMNKITQKRAYHRQMIKVELDDIERLRARVPVRVATQASKDFQEIESDEEAQILLD